MVSYLLGTDTQGIRVTGNAMNCIDVYTDAGEEELEEKATTGFLIMARESPIGWAARKQDVTTLSSTEAEYIALGAGAQDGLWIRKLLEFLGISPSIRLWTDSRGVGEPLIQP